MSNRDINLLTEDTREKYLKLVNKVKTLLGYDIFLTDGFRTTEEQQALYAQGRTKPGNIVTYVDGVYKKSAHQFGTAFDIAFKGGELYPTDHKVWRDVATIAKGLGLDWGFDLWGFDKPHFVNNGKSIENSGEGWSMVGKVWDGERPNEPATRLEVAIMLDRLAGILTDKINQGQK